MILSKLYHLFFFIIFYLFYFSLNADIIQTKTGRFIEGNYIQETKEFLEFETKGEIIKIKKDEVKHLEIGYFGIPFCYKKNGLFDSEECDSLLYSVSENSITVAKGVGYLHREKIPLSNLKYFYAHDLEKNKTLSKVFKENAKLHIRTKERNFYLCKINKITKNILVITEIDTNSTKELLESEISSMEWKQESKSMNYAELPLYVTPGVYQIANEKYWKGFSFSILFFGSVAYAVSNQIAISQSQASQFLLPINNSIFIFEDPNHKKIVQDYTQKRNIAIGVAGFFLGLHILDVFLTEKNFESKSFIGGFHIQLENPKNPFISSYNLENFFYGFYLQYKF